MNRTLFIGIVKSIDDNFSSRSQPFLSQLPQPPVLLPRLSLVLSVLDQEQQQQEQPEMMGVTRTGRGRGVHLRRQGRPCALRPSACRCAEFIGDVEGDHVRRGTLCVS